MQQTKSIVSQTPMTDDTKNPKPPKIDTSDDTVSPSVPGTPTASKVTATEVTLSWTPATDNVKVTRYHVYRNGKEIDTTRSTTYTATVLSPNTMYEFVISARDSKGNTSQKSGVVRVQTSVATTPSPASVPSSIPTAVPGDTTPPTVTAQNATQNLSAGTRSATPSVTTNENATCKYGTSANTAYSALPSTFTTTGGTSHAVSVSGLTDGSTTTYYVRCVDGVGNQNIQDTVLKIIVSVPVQLPLSNPGDTKPPVITPGNGMGMRYLDTGTRSAPLAVSTNEDAVCKYGTVAGVGYDTLPQTFTTTGAKNHQVTVTGLLDNTTSKYYIRCTDGSGNVTTSDVTLSIKVAGVLAPYTPAQSGLSFSSKCTQPGVLHCYRFTDQASVNAVYNSTGAKKPAVYDPAFSAIKLFIPSESAANTSGTINFSHPVIQANASGNDQYWMQYRMYVPQDFLDARFPNTSWKVFVAYHQASCGPDEFTQVNGNYAGYPSYYETCGANSTVKQDPEGNNIYQYDSQPGGDTTCFRTPHGGGPKPCFWYKGNTWTTFTVHLDLTNARVEVWAQHDGESLYKIIDYFLFTTDQISSIFLGPYMTRKDATQVHPEFNMYYQNIIISKNPISMGGGSISATPNKVPLTSSQTKATLQDLLNQLKSLQAELKKLK